MLGCQGMLDFVLMPPRYGFELVLGTNDLQAHHERYLSPVAPKKSHVLQETSFLIMDVECRCTKGLYKMLLDKGYVESYIVIDMQCSGATPKTWQEDNLWHVSFSDDFLEAAIRSADACYSNTM